MYFFTVAAPPPMQAFLPPPPMANMQVPMKHPSEVMEDEPANKKMRTEENLIPEAQFMQRNTVTTILLIYFIVFAF